MTPEMLAKMSGYAKDYNEFNSHEKLPVIKLINDDDDSKFGKGAFVLGQVKEKGKITNEGKKVDTIVVLTTAYAYSFMDEANANNNCRSKTVKDKTQAVGNRLKKQCGRCPMRDEGVKNRCKIQLVVYVMAVVVGEDGKHDKIPAVMYIKGSRYMEAVEFLTTLSTLDYEGKKYPCPAFSWFVKLESERITNEKGQKYFKIKWSKTEYIQKETALDKLAEHAKEINTYIENQGVNVADEEGEETTTSNDPVNLAKKEETPVAKKADIATSNVFDDDF